MSQLQLQSENHMLSHVD